jgi:chromosome partitioning protein
MPATTVAVATNKGGVGKTTLTHHLCHRAAEEGLRTLVADLDPQGNITKFLVKEDWQRLAPASAPSRAWELYQPQRSPRKPLIVRKDLALLPTKPRDEELCEQERAPEEASSWFKARVDELRPDYDLIIFDTPPTLGFLTLVPLLAADFVVSPVKPESIDLEGLASITQTVEEMRRGANPRIKHLGYVLTMCDPGRDRRQGAVIKHLRRELGAQVAPCSTPFSIPMKYVCDSHMPIWQTASSGAERSAADAFVDTTNWILKSVLGDGQKGTKIGRKPTGLLRRVFTRGEARP